MRPLYLFFYFPNQGIAFGRALSNSVRVVVPSTGNAALPHGGWASFRSAPLSLGQKGKHLCNVRGNLESY